MSLLALARRVGVVVLILFVVVRDGSPRETLGCGYVGPRRLAVL